MEKIFEEIIAKVLDCENKKDMFSLPTLSDCQITETDNPTNGSVLCSTSYNILKGTDRIEILYESKDKCRTFQLNPDRSYISMQLYINGAQTKAYSNSWDEKY